ncbi:unnamed protein product [Rotaria sp. Silwood2]|nr:unnamed protein product [Rotaria sp. Silwood2]
MEYSTHVFIQQSPITEQNFESKLQDISDQITTNGCICSNVFAPFTNLAVQQAVVSSRHIAFLLQKLNISLGRVSQGMYPPK